MNPFRSLARDGWVIGIVCAAALAYTAIELVDVVLATLVSIVDGVPAEAYEGTPFDVPYSVVLNGNLIFLEPLLRAALVFVVTVVVSALALHATRSPDDDASS